MSEYVCENCGQQIEPDWVEMYLANLHHPALCGQCMAASIVVIINDVEAEKRRRESFTDYLTRKQKRG